MATLFSRIVAGDIPCHRLAEDELFLAFLDIAPLREGHALVVPKLEVDYLFDMPHDRLAGILPFAKGVAARIHRAIPCARIGVAVIGLEVPHAHVHLVPMDCAADLDFTRPKLAPTPAQLAATAARILAA
jgi:histidine triad (HIT) family protein